MGVKTKKKKTSKKRLKKAVKKSAIKSMTGFGKYTEKSALGDITVEIKTLNHKNLGITCTPFNGIFCLEEKIKNIFDKKIYRGKVFVRITCEAANDKQKTNKINVNEGVARGYLKKIKAMQKKLGVKGDFTINELIALPGVIDNATDKQEDKLWPYVEKTARKAVSNLIEYRESEGIRLAKDFTGRLKVIDKKLGSITTYEKQSANKYRKRLISSIRDISDEIVMDKNKIEAEVALFARNCDIAEEITRLSGHLVEYKNAMEKVKTDVGKKLDFIAQEMQREANTIGSKSADFRISKAVIEIKSEIEKLREQVKNIE